MAKAGEVLESSLHGDVSYTDETLIGIGTFGVVYKATIETGETIAIKKIHQPEYISTSEWKIMSKLDHCNIVKLIKFFYSYSEKDVYLNLVMEYVPRTLRRLMMYYAEKKTVVPSFYVKLFSYQMFRALAYLHSLGVCHSDIRAENLLINPVTGVLKLCDFGSAKKLKLGHPNNTGLFKRRHKPPEIFFGSVHYTTKIDIWSAGCVLAELLKADRIFSSDTSEGVLVEMFRILGTPSKSDIIAMKPCCSTVTLKTVTGMEWHRVFVHPVADDAIALVSQLLKYNPQMRFSALQACSSAFFNTLRNPDAKMTDNKALPPLFNFTEWELGIEPHLNKLLIPEHLREGCSGGEGSGSVNSAGATE